MNFSTYVDLVYVWLSSGTDVSLSVNWLYYALLAMVISVVANALIIYVTMSIALYLIAKRNSYDKKWMAFVPILNYYYIGKLSTKNPFYRIKSTVLGAVMACVVLIYAVLMIFYMVSLYVMIPYMEFSITDAVAAVSTVELGLDVTVVPDKIFWAYWMTIYGGNYLINYFDLVVYIVGLFLLTGFFKTYYPRHYFLFSIVSVLIPWTTGIFMLAVSKNKPVNYFDYMRSEREKSYRRYQTYYGQNGNPYNQNPYSNGNPYQNTDRQKNPFNEYEEKKERTDNQDQNPFDDFN